MRTFWHLGHRLASTVGRNAGGFASRHRERRALNPNALGGTALRCPYRYLAQHLGDLRFQRTIKHRYRFIQVRTHLNIIT